MKRYDVPGATHICERVCVYKGRRWSVGEKIIVRPRDKAPKYFKKITKRNLRVLEEETGYKDKGDDHEGKAMSEIDPTSVME